MRYRRHWCLEAPVEGPRPMLAIATRAGSGASIGVDPEEDEHLGTRLFTVDFAGESSPEPGSEVEAVVGASGGSVTSVTAEYNEPLQAWRANFRIRPGAEPAAGGAAAAAPVEIRCFLKLGEETLSETWLYRWNG